MVKVSNMQLNQGSIWLSLSFYSTWLETFDCDFSNQNSVELDVALAFFIVTLVDIKINLNSRRGYHESKMMWFILNQCIDMIEHARNWGSKTIQRQYRFMFHDLYFNDLEYFGIIKQNLVKSCVWYWLHIFFGIADTEV